MDASVPSEVSLSGEPQPSHPSPRDASHLREVAFLFTRLGFTAFGGPAAHVAMMEDEVVRRRGWIDRRHFLDLVGTLNFIPGPNSTELAIHLGLIRAGLRGLVTAGVCFITPAVLIILPLAWAYVRFGQVYPVRGAMRGIAGAVVAIVAVAGWRFARTAVTDGFTGALAVGAPVGEYFLNRWVGRPYWLQPELAVLALGGLAGVIRLTGVRAGATRSLSLIGLGLPGALLAAADVSPWREMARLAGFFLKVGATLFGSGYVLVSYLRGGLVDAPGAWLTNQQLLDAVAIGQVTPGPLLTTAAFIGYVRGHQLFGTTPGGIAGGVIATAAIFFPSFVLIALFGRVLPRVRENRYARAALNGVNAAVVGLIWAVALRFAWDLRRDLLPVATCCGSLIVLLRWRANASWLIVASAVVGLFAHGFARI
jgi:chromate transporter